MEQRLAQLVFDVQVGRRREDEVRNVLALVAELVDDPHGRVDVALGRTHHADDLEVGPQLASLAAFEHEAQRLPLPLRHRRKADVHDVDADGGEHAGELVLVPRRDRDTGHLLAVAKRVVVDADLFRRGKPQVVRETLRVASQLSERLLQLYGCDLTSPPCGKVAFTSPLAGEVGAKRRVGGVACHQRGTAAPRRRRSSSCLRTHGTSPPIRSRSFMNFGKASARYSSPLLMLRITPCSRSTSSSSSSSIASAACGDCKIGQLMYIALRK